MKNNNIMSFVKRYLIFFLAAALLVSTVLVGSVFGKYTSRKDQSINITVEAFGEINLKLRDGQTATDWAKKDDLYIAPGATLEFDPYVYVGANSETCYLFIEVEENNAIKVGENKVLSYSVASGWTQGDGTIIPANVYYRTVNKNANEQYFQVIANDNVKVTEDITEAMLNGLTEDTTPQIILSAYAVQITNLTDPDRDNTTPEGAWAWIIAQ